MKIAVIVLDSRGEAAANRISAGFAESNVIRLQKKGALGEIVASVFHKYEALVFVMAIGIVVRVIAPHIRSKYSDPAVVVVDDECRFVISCLSGHEGGANGLTYKVAATIDAVPVITTGTETSKKHILGIGCRRGVEKKEVIKAAQTAVAEAALRLQDIRVASTVALKKNESGLVEAMDELGIPLVFVDRERINQCKGPFSPSPVAEKKLSVQGVCEPCAWIVARKARIIKPKTIYGAVTIALIREDWDVGACR